MKKLIRGSALAILFLIWNMAGVSIAEDVPAPPEPNDVPALAIPDEPNMLGRLEGIGNHFEIKDSDFLNVTLDSTEPIKLILESVPEMVTMNIESASGATSTQITLGGFLPSTNYCKYEDDYHNLTTFTTDSMGRYTYIQELSRPHIVFIQTLASTIFLGNTGWSDPTIGTWDAVTRTATLTSDINQTIQIDTNNITLDGNGHILTGSGTGNGVFLSGKSGVTIKNLHIKQFSNGLYLYNSNSNILTGISATSNNSVGIYLTGQSNSNALNGITAASNNWYGIYLYYSNSNILTGISATSNNHTGIYLLNSQSNVLTSNTATLNNEYGISLIFSFYNTLSGNELLGNTYNFHISAWRDYEFNNNIDTSNTVEGKALYYVRNATGQIYDSSTNAGVFYCISCSNVTIKDLVLSKNVYGIYLWETRNSRIENVVATNNDVGIYLDNSDGNILSGNTASSNNSHGIHLAYSIINVLTDNTANSNNNCGIYVSGGLGYTSGSNILTGNTANSNNNCGICLYNSDSNTLNGNSVNSNVRYGIYLTFLSDGTLTDNIASKNIYGINLSNSSGTLTNNITSNNSYGIYFYGSTSTLTNNIISNNYYGIYLKSSANNKIYNNDFISNANQAYVLGGSGNVFNLSKPVGGNYWSNWITPDNDGDGFVDSPYIFYGGRDNLPLVERCYTPITPSRGGNSGQITVSISGDNFVEGITVKLICNNQEIVGRNTIILNNEQLTTTFDLEDVEPGSCDLVVDIPGSNPLICQGCFTVEEGGEAKLWVDFVGRDRIRVGRESPFIIIFGNSGNVNATYPWLAIGMPEIVPYNVDVPWALNDVPITRPPDPNVLNVTLVDLPPLAPGKTDFLKVSVTPSISGFFKIKSRITMDPRPYFQSMLDLAYEMPLSVPVGVSLPLKETINYLNEFELPPLFVREVDFSPAPPAGYILVWDCRGLGGCPINSNKGYTSYHITKSIGGGEFIEMTDNDNGPDLRIGKVSGSDGSPLNMYTPGYQGALKSPLNDSDPNHEKNIRDRAIEEILRWGMEDEKSKWITNLCMEAPGGDVFINNCLGNVHYLDPEFRSWGWVSHDQIFDNLHPYKRWDGNIPGYDKLKYRGTTATLSSGLEYCPSIVEDLEAGINMDTTTVAAFDPNDKSGPAGFDIEGTPADELKRFVADNHSLGYMVFFENLETATAAAQEVLISDQLDPNLNWTTFSFGVMQVGEKVIAVPEDAKNFHTTIDLRPDIPALVDIDCNMTLATGVVTCLFRGKNPDTGELTDFLPPNTDSVDPKGRGWISYSFMPKPGLPTGTVIKNKATIDFEVDIAPDPMETPEVFNTIDSGIPTGNVSPLSAIQTSSSFVVNWSGSDDTGGSAIKNYDIYVSDNGGPYALWLTTPYTSATFTGTNGHQYSFYSRARDNVGNVEEVPAEPDTVTTVISNQPPVALCVDRTANADQNCQGSSSVNNGSYDPDGDSITINQSPADPYNLGTTNITITVIDDKGASDSCTAMVSVIDVTPPSINLSVSPNTLWPPNHKIVLVTPTITATDNCGNPSVKLKSITMNEGDETNTYDPNYDSTTGDGHTNDDIQVDTNGNIYLRAERRGTGSGRIYTITYIATDSSGNSNTANSIVTVPHDQ